MAIQIVITATVDETATNAARDLIAESGRRELAGAKLMDFAKSLVGGRGKPEVGAVKASGTLTGTTVVATNTVTINGLTLTCVDSGATADQWNKGASDTLTMAALAAAINVHASLAGIVTATSDATVVTVSAARPGLLGNAVTLASGQASIVANVARLAGGVDGTSDVIHYYGSGA